MSKMVLAAFATRTEADAAVNELESQGYDTKDFSVITKENKHEAASEAGKDVAGGAASGALTGGAIGGVAGLLAGIGIIPALAGLFIGGPIAAALGLTGAAAATISGATTGAIAGGLIGALTGLGLSKEDAEYYDQTVNKGGLIIGVPAREGDADPRLIFKKHGAVRINEVTTKEARV